MVLDWVPSLRALAPAPPAAAALSPAQAERLKKALALLDLDESGAFDRDELRELLKTIAKATAGAGISAEGIDDKMVDASMSELDADGNGEVSLSDPLLFGRKTRCSSHEISASSFVRIPDVGKGALQYVSRSLHPLIAFMCP